MRSLYTKPEVTEPSPLQKFIQVNHGYYTPTEIARELEVGYDKVLYAYKLMGMKPCTPLEVLLNNLREHPKDTIQELATRYNRHYSYINRLVKFYGLPNPTTAVRGRPRK